MSIAFWEYTIEDGQSLGPGIDIGGNRHLAAILVPANFEGDGFQFQASNAVDGTYYPVVAAGGSAVGVLVEDGEYVLIDDAPMDFKGLRYIKLQSVTSGTPQAQTGDITVILGLRSC